MSKSGKTKVQVIQPKMVVHPRSVKGTFRTIKTLILVVAYAVFFILPWVRWERAVGSNQAIMFDIETRHYYFFDLVIHAQDLAWLAVFLFLAAVLLFYITSLLGRVFCGYFCFQTLWTDAFRLIEQAIQGDRVARIRLDKQIWNGEKIWKKGLTHFFWLCLAFWTGLSFVLYWGDAFELTTAFFTGQAATAAYSTAFILTATTYLAAGWMRENICLHVCPYARFQSAMIDEHSVVVSYDMNRGEAEKGRSKPLKGKKTQEQRKDAGVGDCVDCGYCVQVCPTGVDIRDGLQLGCVQCALCVDACDNIMDKFGWKKGLIRYASEAELEGNKTQWWRLRSVGYGLASLIAAGFLIWGLSSKSMIDASALQTRQPLFVTMSDGRIQNSYELKINNKTEQAATFELSIVGLANAEIDMGKFTEITLPASGIAHMFVKVRYQKAVGEPSKHQHFTFHLTPKTGLIKEPVIMEAQFITP